MHYFVIHLSDASETADALRIFQNCVMEAKHFFIHFYFVLVFEICLVFPLIVPLNSSSYITIARRSGNMHMVIYSSSRLCNISLVAVYFAATVFPVTFHFYSLKVISAIWTIFTSLRLKSWSVSLACHVTSTSRCGNFLTTHQALLKLPDIHANYIFSIIIIIIIIIIIQLYNDYVRMLCIQVE